MEQQYQKAVSIVLKCRLHVESMQKSKAPGISSSDSSGSSTLTRAIEVLKCVNQQAAELANTIKRSLMTIPNSPVSHSPIAFFGNSVIVIVFGWLFVS